jgi:hypothetical protein
MKPIIAALACVLATLPQLAGAADFRYQAGLGVARVIMTGTIEADDDRKFFALIKHLVDGGVTGMVLELDSPGGNVWTALAIADFVYGNRGIHLTPDGRIDPRFPRHVSINTRVHHGEVCGSACVPIFYAALWHRVDPNGFIGVHRVHTVTGGGRSVEDARAFLADIMVAKRLRLFGAPQSVIDDLLATSPDAIARIDGRRASAILPSPYAR